MSTTAVGPAFSLDGPLPVAPQHSLLETRLPTPDGGLRSVVKERYSLDEVARPLNGANVWGYPEGCSLLWEPCSDGTFRVKSEESTAPVPYFSGIVVYKPITCSAIGFDNMQATEFRDRIYRVLEATRSAAIEEALIGGVDGSSNPFIGDGNVQDLTPTPGTAVSVGVGLSILEDAIGSECRMGMIGATPASIAALQAFPVGDVSDRRLVTANGTPVYSSDGLIGLSTPDLAEPDPGEAWMVAHGPVDIYLGPMQATTPKESLDRADNVLTFRAEEFVLPVWDTALQAAVLVDWAS